MEQVIGTSVGDMLQVQYLNTFHSEFCLSCLHYKYMQNVACTCFQLWTINTCLDFEGKKVKSAYGPMWPTRPELIPVSVA